MRLRDYEDSAALLMIDDGLTTALRRSCPSQECAWGNDG
jgi:hypothetical protein